MVSSQIISKKDLFSLKIKERISFLVKLSSLQINNFWMSNKKESEKKSNK